MPFARRMRIHHALCPCRFLSNPTCKACVETVIEDLRHMSVSSAHRDINRFTFRTSELEVLQPTADSLSGGGPSHEACQRIHVYVRHFAAFTRHFLRSFGKLLPIRKVEWRDGRVRRGAHFEWTRERRRPMFSSETHGETAEDCGRQLPATCFEVEGLLRARVIERLPGSKVRKFRVRSSTICFPTSVFQPFKVHKSFQNFKSSIGLANLAF